MALKIWNLGFLLTEIALLILFGAAMLFIGTASLHPAEGNVSALFTLFNIKIALISSISFMIMSGYFITLILVYTLYSHKLSWLSRAILNGTLFLIHSAIFYFFFGESFSLADSIIIVAGCISVFLTEFVSNILWQAHCAYRKLNLTDSR